METMRAGEMIKKAIKTLTYEDSLENLPMIMAQLLMATVALAKPNGFPKESVIKVVEQAWEEVKRVS